MVEFALILPVVLLILVGIIEFGSVYSRVISMRQGIREAGRQGSVAKFGPSPAACTLTGATGSAHIQELMCLAKDQAGVGDGVRIRIVFANANVDTPYSMASGSYQLGNSIVVCAIYPLQSLTGLIQPFLGNRAAKTKAAFRIEKLSAGGVGGETPGSETAPTGTSWDPWCRAT